MQFTSISSGYVCQVHAPLAVSGLELGSVQSTSVQSCSCLSCLISISIRLFCRADELSWCTQTHHDGYGEIISFCPQNKSQIFCIDLWKTGEKMHIKTHLKEGLFISILKSMCSYLHVYWRTSEGHIKTYNTHVGWGKITSTPHQRQDNPASIYLWEEITKHWSMTLHKPKPNNVV